MSPLVSSVKPHYTLTTGGQWIEKGAFSHSSHIAADTDDPALRQWTPVGYSADADLIPEIDTMNPRARDLERNNGLASGGAQTLKDNIIGHVLKVKPKPNRDLLGWTAEQADDWSRKVEGWFETWFGTTECDATGEQTGWGLSHLALGSAFLSGDAVGIPLWKPQPGGIWGTKIKVIESDRLQTPHWLKNSNGKRSVRGGVEKDKDGRPVAYWILKKHPGDALFGQGWGIAAVNDYERIPAVTPWGRRRVIHLYEKSRPEQSRGRTIFAAVMKEFKTSDRYTKAELEAAVANALNAGFLESVASPEAVLEAFGGKPSDYDSKMRQFSMRTGAGVYVPLPYGTTVSDKGPSRPNQAFDGFMESILRKISAGLNMPYEIFSKDFSKTSYASARSALMEAWRYFLSRRRWFAEQWLNPIFEIWMEEAVEKARVIAPDFYAKRAVYCKTNWIMAGRGWTDPWRESRAAEQRMQSNVSNLEDEAAEQGGDWREKVEQRGIEIRAMQKEGIPMPSFIDTQQDDGGSVAVDAAQRN